MVSLSLSLSRHPMFKLMLPHGTEAHPTGHRSFTFGLNVEPHKSILETSIHRPYLKDQGNFLAVANTVPTTHRNQSRLPRLEACGEACLPRIPSWSMVAG